MSMHAVLYKVYKKDKSDCQWEQFVATDIMNEYDLRQFYREQIDLGYLHPDNLADKDITVLDDPQDIDLDAILELLNDNDNYDDKHNYFVEQVSIRLGDNDLYD